MHFLALPLKWLVWVVLFQHKVGFPSDCLQCGGTVLLLAVIYQLLPVWCQNNSSMCQCCFLSFYFSFLKLVISCLVLQLNRAIPQNRVSSMCTITATLKCMAESTILKVISKLMAVLGWKWSLPAQSSVPTNPKGIPLYWTWRTCLINTDNNSYHSTE